MAVASLSRNSNIALPIHPIAMSLLVVGSIAFDSIQTPKDQRERVMGGSGTYGSIAASFFAPVRLVGVVGNDWPKANWDFLLNRGIDLTGVAVAEHAKTFYWLGRYTPDLCDRETLEIELNAFQHFDPVIPHAFRDTPYVFLANTPPAIQLRVIDQLKNPQMVFADTVDLWIETMRPELLSVLRRIDGLLINDVEARQLTELDNVIAAGKAIQRLGPTFVIIKRGEHGAMFFGPDGVGVLPSYPVENIVDPTGAGDSFAGGMMGYLAGLGSTSPTDLKTAMAYGALVASFAVENFSIERLEQIDRAAIEKRMASYRAMLQV
jgi:sugar/nucleoside kinase (ribokinase family)